MFTERYYGKEIDTPQLGEAAINGMLAKLYPPSVSIPTSQIESIEGSYIVCGGGGITPVYIVKSEDLTEYSIEPLKSNIL